LLSGVLNIMITIIPVSSSFMVLLYTCALRS
jgi:hypothetical protein